MEKKDNKMGVFGAVSYVIGNIVGSGIFIAPKAILEETNTVGLALVVWVVSAIISVIGSFCYVELGTSIKTSGADFAYLCYVKWYPIAFAFMTIGCLLTYPATLAIQSLTFSEYIIKGIGVRIADPIFEDFAKKLIGFSLLWLLMFLNFFSLKTFVSRFQILATIAKIAATAIVILTGFYFLIFKGETENIAEPFAHTQFDIGAFVTALFAGLYSYDGWDILNFGAEEIKKPKKTMPLAIIIGMSIVAIIFLSINLAYFVVLDVDQIKESSAVASAFAKAKLGNFYYAVPFLICILLIGSLNSTIFAASRYLYAASRQGHLPSFISCSNTKTDSPRVAIFLCIFLSMAVSFVGDLDTLISYVGFAQWSQRACTMIALLWIRFRHKPVDTNAIRVPIIMPTIFLLICMSLVIVTIVSRFHISRIGLIVITAGFITYFIFIYERSLPSLKSFRQFSFAFDNATTIFCQIIFNGMPQKTEENRLNDEKLNKEQLFSIFNEKPNHIEHTRMRKSFVYCKEDPPIYISTNESK